MPEAGTLQTHRKEGRTRDVADQSARIREQHEGKLGKAETQPCAGFRPSGLRVWGSVCARAGRASFHRLLRSFPKFIFKVNQNNLSGLENLEQGNSGCLAEITLFQYC